MKMVKLDNEQGFIPLLIAVFLILVIGLAFVFMRVMRAGH